MNVNDFDIGKTYIIREKDMTFPGGEVEEGRTLIRKVLAPANKSNALIDDEVPSDMVLATWRTFLRVQCPTKKTIHLLSPENIAAAQPIETE